MRTRFSGTYDGRKCLLEPKVCSSKQQQTDGRNGLFASTNSNQGLQLQATVEWWKRGLICTNEIAAPSSSTERIGSTVSNKHKQQQQGVRIVTMRTRFGGTYNGKKCLLEPKVCSSKQQQNDGRKGLFAPTNCSSKQQQNDGTKGLFVPMKLQLQAAAGRWKRGLFKLTNF